MIWRRVKKKLTQNSSTEKQLKRKEERYQGYLEKLQFRPCYSSRRVMKEKGGEIFGEVITEF